VTKSHPSGRERTAKYLAYGVISCTLFFALPSGIRFLLAVAFLLVVAIVQFVFAKIHDVRCTRDSLEVIDISHGGTVRTRSFLKSEIKRVRFGTVSYSRYSAVTGLLFTAQSNDIKALYGLKCIEAQAILEEIQGLGYDVEHDVAMPMTVEMELSRRKSWFWHWFGS
jgi:hypothetical protein